MVVLPSLCSDDYSIILRIRYQENWKKGRRMVAQAKSTEEKYFPRNRRMRRFGFNNSILSNTTVYLNPYKTESGHISVEEDAFYAVMRKSLQ